MSLNAIIAPQALEQCVRDHTAAQVEDSLAVERLDEPIDLSRASAVAGVQARPGLDTIKRVAVHRPAEMLDAEEPVQGAGPHTMQMLAIVAWSRTVFDLFAADAGPERVVEIDAKPGPDRRGDALLAA